MVLILVYELYLNKAVIFLKDHIGLNSGTRNGNKEEKMLDMFKRHSETCELSRYYTLFR
jgi:hypothetical protein